MTDDRLIPQAEWYYRGSSWILKFFRFCNLMEADRSVLSVTNMYVWFSFWFVVDTTTQEGGTIEMLIAGSNLMIAMGNYGWKRWDAIDKRKAEERVEMHKLQNGGQDV